MILSLCLFGAYLAGSIPFGLAAGYAVKGLDVRKHGSGNLGATNVFRVVGKKWGLAVLFLDALKGYGAVAAAGFMAPNLGTYAMLAIGLTAILGHVFPVWLGFKGGKGVATSLGVFLALIPGPALVTLAIWSVIFGASRIISLASLSAACSFPVVMALMIRQRPEFPAYMAISLLLAGFIFYTHRANVQRLLKKEEKRLF